MREETSSSAPKSPLLPSRRSSSQLFHLVPFDYRSCSNMSNITIIDSMTALNTVTAPGTVSLIDFHAV
jgi:hypothetical protein